MADPAKRCPRLAQVVTRMDIGGVPDHVMTLIRGLRNDYDITMICGNIDDIHRRDLTGMSVKIESIPFQRLLNPLSDLKTFWALYSLFRARRFDIVHTHMSKAALIGSIAAVFAQVPVIINTAHNLGFIALPRRVLKVLFWIYDFLLMRTTMDAVITVSEKIRTRIVETRLLNPKRVHAVHNGLDIRKIAVEPEEAAARRAEFGASSRNVLIVSVARLVWFKGLSTLVAAMPQLLARHPYVRVVVAGDGQLLDDLKRQATELGVIDSMVFAGERRDIPSLLMAADIFVLPSVSEGLPISIMEAMAAEKPVVATDVGGISELVQHGESGLLVPARNPGALAEALGQLAGDAEQRAIMGARAKQRILSDFSPKHMAEQTSTIYHDCLARKGRSI